jgi:hypothetical protein
MGIDKVGGGGKVRRRKEGNRGERVSRGSIRSVEGGVSDSVTSGRR